MAEINFKDLTFEQLIRFPLKDLLNLQAILNEAVEARRTTEKTELLDKMAALASDSGYSLDELLGEKAKKTVKIRYRNPDDPTITWTGRGRKPKWLEALLEAGRSLEEFSV
jgi:DNA-binding protein H-NS